MRNWFCVLLRGFYDYLGLCFGGLEGGFLVWFTFNYFSSLTEAKAGTSRKGMEGLLSSLLSSLLFSFFSSYGRVGWSQAES